MELELITQLIEQGVTVGLLLIFVWFFLSKSNKAQEEMIKMLSKQTQLIEKLIDKVDSMIDKK